MNLYNGQGELVYLAADYLVMETLDPRCPWVTVQRLADSQYPSWRLVYFTYLDPDHSFGDVNVYVNVIDEHGAPVVGMTVVQINGGVTNLATRGDEGHQGEVDFNQTADSSFDPNKPGQVGAYSVTLRDIVTGYPSEKVIGMGLPLRRHVAYHLTFQKVLSAGAPPPPPPTPPPAGWVTVYQDDSVWLQVKK